jgi:hypothetical protein
MRVCAPLSALSLPTSKVRMVTGLFGSALTTAR